MATPPITHFVVAGGGTAGWITAAILARVTEHLPVSITLIESPQVPTVGVGEATIPSMVDLLAFLNIAQTDFIAKTDATFKLGIRFVDWKQRGQEYWHPFGAIGKKIDGVAFYHHWLHQQESQNWPPYADFSPAVAMAKDHRFVIVNNKQKTPLAQSTYAYHLDAAKLALYFKNYCVNKGVKHQTGHIETVSLTPDDDQIESLTLDDHSAIHGDFFFDCTGQNALLIGKALGVAYDNWQKFLPVDRAIVAQTEADESLPPYTDSIAHEHGWRWRIPLQNRVGNGYVYSSSYCSDALAEATLRKYVKGKLITEPRILRFTTGKRQQMWHRNCIAIGLAGGFLEPLESTGIYLIMKAMLNFVELYPSSNDSPQLAKEFNRLMDDEYDGIRDFIVAHYCLTQRTDSRFWLDWHAREQPESLQEKLALFSQSGRLLKNPLDLFADESWYAVLEGMGLRPGRSTPIQQASKPDQLNDIISNYQSALKQDVQQAPTHKAFIEWALEKVPQKHQA